MDTKSVKKSVREFTIPIVAGESPTWGFETGLLAVEAGLVTYEAGEFSPIRLGRELAAQVARDAEVARAKRSAASRARASALRSVGMVRTRGGWE